MTHKKPKAPTLSQLKKLAERKGYYRIHSSPSGHILEFGGFGETPPRMSAISWTDRVEEMYRAMYEALMALPDVKKGER